MTTRLRSALLCISLGLLAACAHQAPPEDVARSFWTAVVDNDLAAAQQHVASNTLDNPKLLSNADHQLKSVEIGATTTRDNAAEVATTLIGSGNSNTTRLPVTTYLIKEDDQWKVHGQQSVNALVASSMNLMMSDMTNSLSGLGAGLTQSLNGGLQEFMNAFAQQMPALRQELDKLTDEEKTRDLGRQLGELMSQGLGEAMKQFNSSLDELGKELEKATPPAEQAGDQKI